MVAAGPQVGDNCPSQPEEGITLILAFDDDLNGCGAALDRDDEKWLVTRKFFFASEKERSECRRVERRSSDTRCE